MANRVNQRRTRPHGRSKNAALVRNHSESRISQEFKPEGTVDRCPLCGITLVNGVCPKCGYRKK